MKSINFNKLVITLFLGVAAINNEPLLNIKFFTNIGSSLFVLKKQTPFDPLRVPLLKNLPKADQLGIVKETFLLQIHDAFSPYNPSAIFDGKNYQVVFRQDIKKIDKNYKGAFSSYIKRVNFDECFNQISPSQLLITTSDTAEDPRIIHNTDNKTILVYNDLRHPEKSKSRIINFCNLAKNEPKAIPLELGFNPYEKNWSPFFKNDQLHFVYQIIPHKVLTIDPADESKLLTCPQEYDHRDFSFWEWGQPRGGTPCIEINGEYLSFFHSYFTFKGKTIYVVGAYTFEKEAPFRIKTFSRFPLVFDGIYSAKLQNTADRNKRVIYPSGLVYDQAKDELLVFCGENDCAIRVLRINPKKLALIMDDPSEKKIKKGPL